jgi:hypothetical protein
MRSITANRGTGRLLNSFIGHDVPNSQADSISFPNPGHAGYTREGQARGHQPTGFIPRSRPMAIRERSRSVKPLPPVRHSGSGMITNVAAPCIAGEEVEPDHQDRRARARARGSRQDHRAISQGRIAGEGAHLHTGDLHRVRRQRHARCMSWPGCSSGCSSPPYDAVQEGPVNGDGPA